MGYEVGDRVRLAIPYGGLPHDGTPGFVEVGDEGTVVEMHYGSTWPVMVQFDGKNLLKCGMSEVEPV